MFIKKFLIKEFIWNKYDIFIISCYKDIKNNWVWDNIWECLVLSGCDYLCGLKWWVIGWKIFINKKKKKKWIKICM